jgi:hypothetical protein
MEPQITVAIANELAESQIFRNNALVWGGAIGFILAIWRSIIANKQAKTAQQQAQIATENHLAGTFTKAIDQVGQKEEGIQLGGLYALEDIALSNKKYHGQIMEVLCAFIKFHSPREEEPEQGWDYEDRDPIKKVVQVALTIIGRRNVAFDEPTDLYRKFKIDLSRTNLYSASLEGANLQGASFECADLEDADLLCSNLEQTNLGGAILKGAIFTNQVSDGLSPIKVLGLDQILFTGAKLSNTNLQGANLLGASITLGQLNKAYINEDTKIPGNINRDLLKNEIP